MANTPISVRLDEELLGFVDAEASRRRWSRNAVIQACIEEGLPDLEKESVGQSRKKIADVSDGGDAQGGTQDLPRGGKAQDGENIPTTHKCCGFEGVVTRGAGGVFDVVTCDCKCHENSEPDTEIGMTTRELGELGQKIFGKVVRRNKNAEKENMPEVQKDDAPDADRKGILPSVRKEVDVQALRAICAGKPIVLPPYVVDEFERKTAEVDQEISLCWRQEYNQDTGQTGACGLAKGHKGKCGAWEIVG